MNRATLRRYLLGGLFGWCCLLLASGASATLITDTVRLGFFGPTAQELCFLCGGYSQVQVVAGSGDIVQPYLAGEDWFEVDIDADSLRVRFLRDVSWGMGDFVGLIVDQLDWVNVPQGTITGVQISSSLAGFDATRITYEAQAVLFNWQGISIPAGTTFDVNLVTSDGDPVRVDEPAGGFALLAFLALLSRRRRPRPHD